MLETKDTTTNVFILPNLPYSPDALEPHIDAQTMEIHHGKHHKGYVEKLNAALSGHADLRAKTLGELLTDLSSIPEDIREKVRNNGGGHYNHSLFWGLMSANGGGEPQGSLNEAIAHSFGDFLSFKKLFSDTAASQFGSGWAWLVKKSDDSLAVYSTANQDNPLMQGDMPIFGLDVWEHAYYLKYQNRRPEYISAWWNRVDWQAVQAIFEQV